MNKTDILEELFFILQTLKTKKLTKEKTDILYNHYIKLKNDYNL